MARAKAIYAQLDQLLEEIERFSGEWLAWLQEELAFAKRYGTPETVRLLEELIEKEEAWQWEQAAPDLKGTISHDRAE